MPPVCVSRPTGAPLEVPHLRASAGVRRIGPPARSSLARLAMTSSTTASCRWASLRDVSFAGSFEGQTKIALGVSAELSFRVSTIEEGGYTWVVVDIAHPADCRRRGDCAVDLPADGPVGADVRYDDEPGAAGRRGRSTARLWRAVLAWSASLDIASDAVAEAFAQAARRGRDRRWAAGSGGRRSASPLGCSRTGDSTRRWTRGTGAERRRDGARRRRRASSSPPSSPTTTAGSSSSHSWVAGPPQRSPRTSAARRGGGRSTRPAGGSARCWRCQMADRLDEAVRSLEQVPVPLAWDDAYAPCPDRRRRRPHRARADRALCGVVASLVAAAVAGGHGAARRGRRRRWGRRREKARAPTRAPRRRRRPNLRRDADIDAHADDAAGDSIVPDLRHRMDRRRLPRGRARPAMATAAVERMAGSSTRRPERRSTSRSP